MKQVEAEAEFISRLGELRYHAEARFEILRAAGKVKGEFHDTMWGYAGRNLNFVERAPNGVEKSNDPTPLPGVAGVLARCFMVASFERGLSSEGAYSRLQGVRWLSQVTGGGTKRWVALSPLVLNRVLANLQKEQGASTVYNRASSLVSFVDFLNSTRTGSGETASTLLGRHVSWRHGLKNPIRRAIEIGADDVDALGSRKYQPNLHRALGEARSKVRINPELEPSPGYDLIRLEGLAFAMATGIRIGELCALSVQCFDTHEGSGTPFLRVATEKGQPPSARPIAEIWAPAVSEAYDYLLERCAAARRRAREIDRDGFKFIPKALLDARALCPIDPAFEAQMHVLRLARDEHFLIEEVVGRFDVSSKEFASDGRFRDCAVPLPRIVAARVVSWVDERMSLWDWSCHSILRTDVRTGQVGTRSLSASQIATYVGGGGSCLAKASWFYPQFRRFLIALSDAGSFDNSQVSRSVTNRFRKMWSKLRERALANRGGGKCTAVNIKRFIAALSERYRAHLELHYRELVSYDEGGVPIPGRGTRAGVPRRLGEHLIVVWEGEFSGLTRKGILPRPIFRSDFYSYLSSNAQKRTIFERLDLRDNTGKHHSMSPHQIRHWVTTAIYRSGPTEMMVDLWMGRSVGQSRIYDHRTAKERAEAIRERYLSNDLPGDYLGRQVRFWRESGLDAEEIEEHVRSRLRVLHFVPSGGCSRELFLAPCTKGLLCLRGFGTSSACPSFHIDVQDSQARTQILVLRDRYRAMLSAVYPLATDMEEAFKDELNSAEVLDQHLIHIKEVIRGCEQALKAYETGAAADGPSKQFIPVKVLS